MTSSTAAIETARHFSRAKKVKAKLRTTTTATTTQQPTVLG